MRGEQTGIGEMCVTAGGTCVHVPTKVCLHTYAQVCVCVWPKLYECPFFSDIERRMCTYPSAALTYPNNPLACRPVCVTRLSPDTSQEGCNANFFSPRHGRSIGAGSVGLVKLLFKDFIPHNHLHTLTCSPAIHTFYYHSLLISLCG